MPRLIPTHDARLFGDEKLLLDANLLDFWTWAFGDLCDDDIKGIFAEWMVAKLLGIPTKRRVSWANSDLITPDQVRIEVKSSAYWQSWKLVDEFGESYPKPIRECRDEDSIGFAGLQARDARTVSRPTDLVAYKSDLYVFAFENERDPDRWNALDLSQWEFYVFPVDQLRQFANNRIRLVTLRELQKGPLKAAPFMEVARRMIAEIAASRRPMPTSEQSPQSEVTLGGAATSESSP